MNNIEERILLILEALPESGGFDGEVVSSDLTEETRDYDDFFSHKNWRSVKAVDLWNYAESINFMTLSAFTYFLPAIIKCSIEDLKLAHMAVSRALWRMNESEFHESARSFEEANKVLLSEWLKWLRDISEDGAKYGMRPQAKMLINNMNVRAKQ